MVKKTVLMFWLLLVITMPIGSYLIVNNIISFTYPILILSLVQPYLVLVLSLYVFNRTPSQFRIIHHSFILLTFILSIGFSYNFIFHGGEQGGVGTYILTYGVAVTYLCFISLFLLALAIKKIWFKSK